MHGSRRLLAQARLAVVPLPATIDITNARHIGDELDSAFAPGVRTVVADMTLTTFCDSSGAGELVLAHKKAAAEGINLRLAMPSGAVRRIFEIIGLDQVLAIYPSLDAAMPAGYAPEAPASHE